MPTILPRSNIIELLWWLCRRRRHFRVTGQSMQPMLQPGELVLVNPYAYLHAAPEPGDVVLANHPYQRDLKIIKQVQSVHAQSEHEDGRCFLVGVNPNRLETTDSHSFGEVSNQNIVGRVTSILG